jgi:peptide/nickel transport system substrate-binding protein
VAGCAPSTPDPCKDTCVVAMGGPPFTLDPHGSNDQASSRVHRQIYETLIYHTESLDFVPSLATSWTQVDDLTFEFKLKSGVKFHNGGTLTESDVKFTLERSLASPFIGHIVGPIDKESVKVVDDLTIRFSTTRPFVPMLIHLAHPAIAILNEKAVTEGGVL